MKEIENAIKEKYGTKGNFCQKNNFNFKALSSKINTLKNKINWVNNFLELIDLKIIIKQK